MTLWIDEPIWPAHSRLFAHLVSDVSYDELHRFARMQGLHPRSFEGDHYDVPQERWQDLVAAGASPTTGVDLVRRLNASGLRLRKRKGDRGLMRHLGVPVLGGVSDVDLVASKVPVREEAVFAAMVFLRDRCGHFAAVYSLRRAEWGSPGGSREPGERPIETAVREVSEETGILIPEDIVHPGGYERFTPRTAGNVIDPRRPYLQVYRARLEDVRPDITQGDDGIRETRWVTAPEYAALCGHLFWWPLAVENFPDLASQ
ncbi:MAG: DUF4031 domain-containing protein [Micrococcales bacterium]|nr:DUF4031 domain-containing protein [Micrococcales bacterium]